jgi:hypothetical protein
MQKAVLLDDSAFYPYYEYYYTITVVNEINRATKDLGNYIRLMLEEWNEQQAEEAAALARLHARQ